jgi:hypothetical protein
MQVHLNNLILFCGDNKIVLILIHTHPKEYGKLFPVPSGTVATGGGCSNLRSDTTPSNQPAVPSPPAT